MLNLQTVAPVQYGSVGPRKPADSAFGAVAGDVASRYKDEEAIERQPSLPTETKWKAALLQLSLRQAKSAPSFHAPATAHPYGRDGAASSESRRSKMPSTTQSMRREKTSQSHLRQAKSAPSVQASATTRSFGSKEPDFSQSRHSKMVSSLETTAAPYHNQIGKPSSQRVLNPNTISPQNISLVPQRALHPRVESLQGRQMVNPGTGRAPNPKNDSCLDREVVHQNTGRPPIPMGDSFLDQQKANPRTAKDVIQDNFHGRKIINPRTEVVLPPKSASFQIRKMTACSAMLPMPQDSKNTKIDQVHTETVLKSSTWPSHPTIKKSVSLKVPSASSLDKKAHIGPGGSKEYSTRQMLVMWNQSKTGLSSDSMPCSSQDIKSQSLRVVLKEATSEVPATRQRKKRPSSMRSTDWFEESGETKKAKLSTMTNKVSDQEFHCAKPSSSATVRAKDHGFVQPGAHPSAMDFCRGEIPVTSTPKVKLGKMMSISQFIKINDSVEIQEIQDVDDSGKQPADKETHTNIGNLDNTVMETIGFTNSKNVEGIRKHSLAPSTERSSSHTRKASSSNGMVPSEGELKDIGDIQIQGIKRIMHLAEPSPTKLRKADTNLVGAHLERAVKGVPSFKEIPQKRRIVHQAEPYSPEKLRKTDRDINPLPVSRAIPSMQLDKKVKTAPSHKEVPTKRRLVHQEEVYSPEKMRKMDRYVHKLSVQRKMKVDGAFDETQGFKKLMHLAEPVSSKMKETDSDPLRMPLRKIIDSKDFKESSTPEELRNPNAGLTGTLNGVKHLAEPTSKNQNRCLGNFPAKFLMQMKSTSTMETQAGASKDELPTLVWAAKCIKRNAGHTPRPLKRFGRNKYQERLID